MIYLVWRMSLTLQADSLPSELLGKPQRVSFILIKKDMPNYLFRELLFKLC